MRSRSCGTGRALAGRRDEAVIATKFGFHVDEAAEHVTFRTDPRDAVRDLRADCERSLRHLATDVIDLYLLHVWDYPHDLAVELREALETLVQEGKIRSYGWSTDDVGSARVFADGEHCAAVQHDLNVVRDAPEILALCEQADLASVNRRHAARSADRGADGADGRTRRAGGRPGLTAAPGTSAAEPGGRRAPPSRPPSPRGGGRPARAR